MTENKVMKILKIENGNGFFKLKSEWKPIDEINKDGLMDLLNLLLENEVEMDNLDENTLSNQAQLIIYKSIFEKFSILIDNKDKFKDESDRTYLDEIQKYSEK